MRSKRAHKIRSSDQTELTRIGEALNSRGFPRFKAESYSPRPVCIAQGWFVELKAGSYSSRLYLAGLSFQFTEDFVGKWFSIRKNTDILHRPI